MAWPLFAGGLMVVIIIFSSVDKYPHHSWAIPPTKKTRTEPIVDLSIAGSIAVPNFRFSIQDQRAIVAYEALQGITPEQTIRNLKAKVGRRNVRSDRTIRRWHKEVRDGTRTDTEDHRSQCPGRPRTANTDENWETLDILMSETRSWTLDQLAEVMNISHGSVYNLLHEKGFKKLGSNFVPHELTCDQKEKRVEVAQMNLDNFTEDATILGRIVSLDETWLPAYMPLHPQDSREWRLAGEDR
jgi:transposase